MRHVDDSSLHLHRNKRTFQPEITSYFHQNHYPQQQQYGQSHQDQDIDIHQLHFHHSDHFQNSQSPDRRGPGPITRTHLHHLQQHQYTSTSTTTTPTANRHDSPASSSFSSSFPPLPHPVQVNLLSVGMRVRKSVPEGYKTNTAPTNTKTSFLPSIQTTLSRPRPDTLKLPRESLDTALQHQRELLPFCGLQKIGGYAEQPVTNIHLYGGNDTNGDKPVNLFPLPAETFSQPFTSHSSTSTSSFPDSLPLNPQKRSWHDEDEVRVNLNDGFLFKMQMRGIDDDVPVSPLSETPMAKGIMRPFAQPKTRRVGTTARILDSEPGLINRKDADVEMEVENASVQKREDFEDAEFLRWGEREVHMGGL